MTKLDGEEPDRC